MGKFSRTLLKFSLVVLIFVAVPSLLYLKRDPYSDFGIKDNYSWTYRFQTLGDISTKKLLISKRKHNAFIFGSSRSCGLYACYLQEKIPNSKFFHYAHWSETIGGMYRKLKLIDSLGYSIDHAIFYLDTDNTFKDSGAPSDRDHHLISGISKTAYRWKHYYEFFSTPNSDKLKILLGKELNSKNFPNWTSDILTNDVNLTCSDSIIKTYGDSIKDDDFLKKIEALARSGFLYKRPVNQVYLETQISHQEEQILKKIKTLLAKHRTNYYLIITPLYDQLKFSNEDISVLRRYFGNRIYDFSGQNEITNDISNYPDQEHFLRQVSKKMVDSILN